MQSDFGEFYSIDICEWWEGELWAPSRVLGILFVVVFPYCTIRTFFSSLKANEFGEIIRLILKCYLKPCIKSSPLTFPLFPLFSAEWDALGEMGDGGFSIVWFPLPETSFLLFSIAFTSCTRICLTAPGEVEREIQGNAIPLCSLLRTSKAPKGPCENQSRPL